ncbi:break repair meiotic recombinase recruitment factor 1 isoform X2 [Moschus berezovskii]|uniref:break repair meiotic recombinase recruitment factor 1 isoform X2 n=1 Tax=Moschus berezovskii TaxID=68408 RepID=UPI00244375A0|nr:break repair meiotic recombinase recruitment factor 1 isoform X2 [Moschus berezovskii]
MSKRKKLRTSGREGLRLPKLPKNPRIEDSDRTSSLSSMLDYLHHPEESESGSGLTPSAERSGEEPGQAAASTPDNEADTPSRLLGQPEREPVPLPPSQGTLPEPSAQLTRSQPQEESLGLALQEARDPGHQTQADGTCTEPSGLSPMTSGPSDADPQPSVSTNASPELGAVPSVLERAGQDHLSEPRTIVPKGGSIEEGWAPGNHGQKGPLPGNNPGETEPEQGSPQQGGTRGLAGADLLDGHQEEGGNLLDPEPPSAALGPPYPLQTLGREAEWSWSGPRCPPLGAIVIADVNTDPAEPEHRTLRVARPDGEVSARVPASPSGKAPDAGLSRALLSGTPLTGATSGGRREAQREDEPPGDILGCFAASLPLPHETQEPTLGARDPSPSALETGPGVGQTQVPGPDQGLGGVCSQPWLSQPTDEKATELGSRSHKQDLKGLSLSLRASAAPMYQEGVGSPAQDAGAGQGSPDTPTGPVGQPQCPADSSKQAIWEGSPAMELDFLPDSQIEDALKAPGFEAPPEQLFPAGDELDPCWPGTVPRADRGPLAEAQPRTQVGIKTCEATSMEDATDTLRGLVMELSNLNRLIMSAHRDLETFKRLNYYWKAKPAGKAPTPYTAKGAGTLPRGEQSWRDL